MGARPSAGPPSVRRGSRSCFSAVREGGLSGLPTLAQFLTVVVGCWPTAAQAQPFSIAGQIRYYHGGAPVSGITVELHGPTPTTTQTDAQGHFVFSGLAAGTWWIRPQQTGNAANGINALDASYVLQDVVGLRSLDANQRLAGDATGNGAISALDATRILQDVVGLITSVPVAPACGGDWVFVPGAGFCAQPAEHRARLWADAGDLPARRHYLRSAGG